MARTCFWAGWLALLLTLFAPQSPATTATITIKYDGDGSRVSKTIATATNTVTTCYQVDELNPSGYAQVLEEYVSINSQPPTLNGVYTHGHTQISQDRRDGATWHMSFYSYDGHNVIFAPMPKAIVASANSIRPLGSWALAGLFPQ